MLTLQFSSRTEAFLLTGPGGRTVRITRSGVPGKHDGPRPIIAGGRRIGWLTRPSNRTAGRKVRRDGARVVFDVPPEWRIERVHREIGSNDRETSDERGDTTNTAGRD